MPCLLWRFDRGESCLWSCVVRLQVGVANGGVVGCVPSVGCEIQSLFSFVLFALMKSLLVLSVFSLLFGIGFLFFLEVRWFLSFCPLISYGTGSLPLRKCLLQMNVDSLKEKWLCCPSPSLAVYRVRVQGIRMANDMLINTPSMTSFHSQGLDDPIILLWRMYDVFWVGSQIKWACFLPDLAANGTGQILRLFPPPFSSPLGLKNVGQRIKYHKWITS
jgi:hypothetical protein